MAFPIIVQSFITSQDMLVILFSLILTSNSEKIVTYFLNSEFDYRAYQDEDDPNIECVHTDPRTVIPLPGQVTICYRSNTIMYTNYEDPFISFVGLGTIKPDFLNVVEGVAFGIWKYGPWVGFNYESFHTFDWFPLGEINLPDLGVWRHTCLSIDFDSGNVTLTENGGVRMKTQVTIRRLGNEINHVAVGCFYRDTGTPYPSMYGRITDFQIFGRILSDSEMESVTGCRARMEGDVVSWDKTQWVTSGPRSIKKEYLDFKTTICTNPEKSYHIVPQPSNFIPESLDICNKFSARLAGHHDKAEFLSITEYLAQENVLRTEECVAGIDKEENTVEVSTWLAIHDNDEELVWKHWYTGQSVTPLPWADNRPYQDGESYNCVRLRLGVERPANKSGVVIRHALLNDDQCYIESCPVCSVDQPVLRIYVRGLCTKSLFNGVYMYTINRSGDILYLGEFSSSISYNSTAQLWEWYDSKDPNSLATSSSSYDSLLIGVHTFDFSGVVDEKCKKDRLVRRLKFTTCSLGEFTCDDGGCINIEERCDQIEQCQDKSDENNCHFILLESDYKKNIAPFIMGNNNTDRQASRFFIYLYSIKNTIIKIYLLSVKIILYSLKIYIHFIQN